MSAVETYRGRLVCTGDGHLYAHPDPSVDPFDTDGRCVLRKVAADPESDSYVYIDDDTLSHNERHGKNDVDVSMTVGDLYEPDGKGGFTLVRAADPHHDSPTPDDPHYNENARNKTETVTLDDSVAETISGHTEAYKGGHE